MFKIMLQIIRAKHDHARIIHEILIEAFAPFEEVYTAEAYQATIISPNEVGQRIDQGVVWLAVLNDIPVGTVAGRVVEQDTFYIKGMAVLPAAQGQQLGYRLLHKLEMYARSIACRSLLLNTTHCLQQAIRLYERYGFQLVEEPPYEFYGMPLLNMRKVLV